MTEDNAAGIQDAAALDIVDGRITAVYAVRNPEKLRVSAG